VVTFTYDASDPAQLTYDEATGTFAAAPGKLRLWLRNAEQPRSKNSAAAIEDPGDFIPNGVPVKLSTLGLSSANRAVTLYVEAVGHGTGDEPERVEMTFDPDGAQNPLPAICHDTICVRPLRLEFAISQATDDQSGLPAEGADAVATSSVAASDPRPVVVLDELGAEDVSISNGSATLTLSGSVRDAIADNTPRGTVSEGRADIETVRVFVNGVEACEPATVQSHEDGEPSLFRRHPYKGTFGPITASFPLCQGTHNITVVTSENAVGLTGCDSLEIRVGTRQIPGSSPGPGALTLTANLYFLAEPAPGAADSVQYYYGEREAQEGDPILCENPGEEASLRFRGCLDGVLTEIAVTNFQGLTDEQDSLEAEIVHAWPDGARMQLKVTMSETGHATNLFRGILNLQIGQVTSVQNIHFPTQPAPQVADSVRYYLGEREPDEEDPVLAENEGEEDSLVFRGTALGLPTTITVTEFTGLTENTDSLTAEVTYNAGEGTTWTSSTPFTETGATTNLFRAADPLQMPANGGQFALTTHYRVVIPNTPDPDVPDTVRFYLGDTEPPDGGTPLMETENDSLHFTATLENGATIEAQLVQFDGLSDVVDQATIALRVSHPDLHTYSFERTYTETGPATDTFDYTEPGDVLRSACACIESVRNINQASENRCRPVTLRVRGLPNVQDYTIRVPAGGEFALSDQGDGAAYIAFGDTPLVGLVVRGESGTEFLYWDAEQQSLATIPLGEGTEQWNAELVQQSTGVVATRSAGISRVCFLDMDGAETAALEPVPIRMLLDTLDDQEVVIEDQCFARLRLHGFNSRTRVTITSEELPTDSFELVPDGATPSAPRHSLLLDQGGWAESDKRICIYEPDDEHTELTDAQWQSLADVGILAVHNAGARAGVLKGAQEVLKGFHDHHLFSKFRKNSDYARFWTEVFGDDFDIDDFTVPVAPERHFRDMNQITKRWKAFIDNQRQLMKAGKPLKKVQAESIAEMLNIADDFGYDVSQVRRYRSNARRGSSLAKLYYHAQKAGKIDLKTNTRWRRMIGRASKRLGKRAMQVLKFAGYALTAYFVFTFVADPAGAAAAELGISRDTFVGWLEGRVHAGIQFWPYNGTEVDAVQLKDGSILVVGQWAFIAKYDPKDKKFHRYKYVELKKIVVKDTPGVADLTFDDGSQKGFTLEGVSETVNSEP